MKKYINAEIEVIMLNDANVISTSGDNAFDDFFGTSSGSEGRSSTFNPWNF